MFRLRLGFLAIVAGALAGAAAVVLSLGVTILQDLTLTRIAGLEPPLYAGEAAPSWLPLGDAGELKPVLLVAVMVAGGLVVGLLLRYWSPEAEGSGTALMLRTYHERGGRLPLRVTAAKMVTSIVTLGTGGAGGQEGPMALIGGGLGSAVGRQAGAMGPAMRLLFSAGMAGGIASAFHVPLAGPFFAAEVWYRSEEVEGDAVVPAVLAAAVASIVYGLVLGTDPLFATSISPGYEIDELRLLLPIGIITVALALAGGLFRWAFVAIKHAFADGPVSFAIRPAIGAAGVAVVFLVADVGLGLVWGDDGRSLAEGLIGSGYGLTQHLLLGGSLSEPLLALAIVAVLRVVTTSLTIGSGGSAGLFGPGIVIGATVGSIVVGALDSVWPGGFSPEEASVLVLLAVVAFFTSTMKIPLTAVVLAADLTGRFALVVPGAACAALAFLLSTHWTLFAEQRWRRADSPAHAPGQPGD